MKHTIYIHAHIVHDGRVIPYACSHSMDDYHSAYGSYMLLETRDIEIDMPEDAAQYRVNWLKRRRKDFLDDEIEKIDNELAQWQGVET